MKFLYLIILFIINIQINSQVYISEKSNGHNIDFLIINGDSIIIESYNLNLKTLPVKLTRKFKANKIINNTEKKILTKKFEIVKKSKDTLCINNICYLLYYKSDKWGDFAKLDEAFVNFSNIEKLNLCRNCYFLLHPPKAIEIKLKKYPKKDLKIIEDVNCRQDHSDFLKDLLELLK